MTLPLFESEMGSLSDGDEQELSRVTVLVGRLLIDVGVPSRVITSAVANDVIELANDQLPARTGLGTPSIMLKAGGRSRASRPP
jgi:hypothetical protein